MGYRIAVVGATGNVGREIVQVLEERRFPLADLVPLASDRSAGGMISFGEEDLRVQDLASFDFAGIDLVFSATTAEAATRRWYWVMGATRCEKRRAGRCARRCGSRSSRASPAPGSGASGR